MYRVFEHRQRALSPDHPVLRGTAQNPDVYFQAREASNPYYAACPEKVQGVMHKFSQVVGRSYQLFDYSGAPDAERIIVMKGSGAESAQETVEYLNRCGEKVGLVKVRLYRPFSMKHFLEALPTTVKKIAVLDCTKESGSAVEHIDGQDKTVFDLRKGMNISATVLTVEPVQSVTMHTVVTGQAPPRPNVTFEGPMLIEPTREAPAVAAAVEQPTAEELPKTASLVPLAGLLGFLSHGTLRRTEDCPQEYYLTTPEDGKRRPGSQS